MASSNPVLCGSIAARPGTFGVAMHNAAFRALGLNYVYIAFGTEDTEGAMVAMRALGIRGLGVTMPHKVRVMEYLDALDDTARTIGAVNTVVNENGRLSGYNVDWIGFVRAVGETGTSMAGIRAAVIGAGGGARSVVHGLLRQGASVTIYNRSAEPARVLAASFGCVYGGAPGDLEADHDFSLLAHVTPVGFHDPDTMALPTAALRPGLIVFDAVPMPIKTKLLRAAAKRGCRTVPGVRMQLHQAAAQFELYTGRAPDLAVMERALSEVMAAAT